MTYLDLFASESKIKVSLNLIPSTIFEDTVWKVKIKLMWLIFNNFPEFTVLQINVLAFKVVTVGLYNNLLLLLLLLSRFSHVWLCVTPPGSPVPGIFQAKTLGWVAISFSNAWKWKVKGKSLSRVQLLAIPWTAAYLNDVKNSYEIIFTTQPHNWLI